MLNYVQEDMGMLSAGIDAPLSPRAHVLWHYLLYFNNKAAIFVPRPDGTMQACWPVWFEVDNRLLVKVMDIKDSSRIYDYRKVLIDRGYIRFDPGTGGGHRLGNRKPLPRYALTPFTTGAREALLNRGDDLSPVPVWVFDPAEHRLADQCLPISINTINNKSIYTNHSMNKPLARDIEDERLEAIQAMPEGEAKRQAMREWIFRNVNGTSG